MKPDDERLVRAVYIGLVMLSVATLSGTAHAQDAGTRCVPSIRGGSTRFRPNDMDCYPKPEDQPCGPAIGPGCDWGRGLCGTPAGGRDATSFRPTEPCPVCRINFTPELRAKSRDWPPINFGALQEAGPCPSADSDPVSAVPPVREEAPMPVYDRAPSAAPIPVRARATPDDPRDRPTIRNPGLWIFYAALAVLLVVVTRWKRWLIARRDAVPVHADTVVASGLLGASQDPPAAPPPEPVVPDGAKPNAWGVLPKRRAATGKVHRALHMRALRRQISEEQTCKVSDIFLQSSPNPDQPGMRAWIGPEKIFERASVKAFAAHRSKPAALARLLVEIKRKHNRYAEFLPPKR